LLTFLAKKSRYFSWLKESGAMESPTNRLDSRKVIAAIAGSGGRTAKYWEERRGRSIAALRIHAHQVFLWTRKTGRSRKLGDGITSNDLAWVPDSRSLLGSHSEYSHQRLVHVSLQDERQVPKLNFSDFHQAEGHHRYRGQCCSGRLRSLPARGVVRRKYYRLQ
jgi:hypothetical protein